MKRLAIMADYDNADDDDGGDQEAEQYAHGGDVGDDDRKLAYQRIPLRADAVFFSDPKGPNRYERIMPSVASQKSGIAYDRIPRTGEPQGEPDHYRYLPPIYSGDLKQGYRLPHRAIVALGAGDYQRGLNVSDKLFGHHRALGRGVVHPLILELEGNGDINAGRKVLRRFAAMVRGR
jgi:hypothetical protein